jgi:hypothetical protein
MVDLAGGQTVLSGAISGRRVLSSLIAMTSTADTPTTAFLNFAGIEVATASFLRDSVIAFRDYGRLSLPKIYPVVANLTPAVTEELEFFVRARSEVLWSCCLSADGRVDAARLIGDLDPAQRQTFDAVRELGATSAPELAIRFADPRIGATAWNNRLSALASKGLLVERRRGKTKSFSPVLEMPDGT